MSSIIKCLHHSPNITKILSTKFSKVQCNFYCTNVEKKIISKQLIMHKYGEPHDVVKLTSTALPHLKPGQVLIKFLASTINPADINTVQGTYAVKPSLPCVLGNEGVATVLETHSKNDGDIQKGDLVIPANNAWGTWRTHAIATPNELIKIPNDLDRVSGAVLAVNPSTAYRMLKDFVELRPGDTIIQNGANSAVGRAAIQLCSHYGYRSINVVRDRPNISELKDELKALGADVVVTEQQLRTDKSLKTLSQPKLALNCVSGRSGAELLRHLRHGGTMVTYGGMARQPVTVPVGSLIFNDIKVMGYWQTHWNNNPSNKTARANMLNELATLFKQKKLVPPPHKLVKFENFLSALEDTMPSQGQVGTKQILCFD